MDVSSLLFGVEEKGFHLGSQCENCSGEGFRRNQWILLVRLSSKVSCGPKLHIKVKFDGSLSCIRTLLISQMVIHEM